MKRHRHQEWLKFIRRIEAETPKHLDLHLIADNYATHNPLINQSTRSGTLEGTSVDSPLTSKEPERCERSCGG
jgi:hypothetical protein